MNKLILAILIIFTSSSFVTTIPLASSCDSFTTDDFSTLIDNGLIDDLSKLNRLSEKLVNSKDKTCLGFVQKLANALTEEHSGAPPASSKLATELSNNPFCNSVGAEAAKAFSTGTDFQKNLRKRMCNGQNFIAQNHKNCFRVLEARKITGSQIDPRLNKTVETIQNTSGTRTSSDLVNNFFKTPHSKDHFYTQIVGASDCFPVTAANCIDKLHDHFYGTNSRSASMSTVMTKEAEDSLPKMLHEAEVKLQKENNGAIQLEMEYMSAGKVTRFEIQICAKAECDLGGSYKGQKAKKGEAIKFSPKCGPGFLTLRKKPATPNPKTYTPIAQKQFINASGIKEDFEVVRSDCI